MNTYLVVRLRVVRSIAVLAFLALGGCLSRGPTLPALPEIAIDDANYRLTAGDVIRIDVFDIQALSGEFRLDDSGRIVVPLIGSVPAGGLSQPELAELLTTRLTERYLKDPNVTVRVQEYRRLSVLGEVARPGDYAYTTGTTVLGAIAKAGGYSYRADHGDVVVTRAGKRFTATPLSRLQPGDLIEVGERYF
jgi:polysaccharide export outer membrane protein